MSFLGLLKNKYFIGAAIAAVLTYIFCNALYDAEISELRQEYSDEKKRIAEAHQDEIQRALSKERDLRDRLQELDEIHYKELQDAKSDNAELRDRIASGDLRLSIPTRNQSCSSVPEGSGAASVDNGESRTELDPIHAQRIIRITDYGDEQIRKLTACQAYVKELVRTINSTQKKGENP